MKLLNVIIGNKSVFISKKKEEESNTRKGVACEKSRNLRKGINDRTIPGRV